MTLEALEQAFATWRDALNGGDLETCYGLMAEDMVVAQSMLRSVARRLRELAARAV